MQYFNEKINVHCWKEKYIVLNYCVYIKQNKKYVLQCKNKVLTSAQIKKGNYFATKFEFYSQLHNAIGTNIML